MHLDYADKEGKHFLVLVDSHSKWLEVMPTGSNTTAKTIELLRDKFASFGIPLHLVSDNGPHFTSGEFENFCKANGIRHTLVAPYHPASNGQAERG